MSAFFCTKLPATLPQPAHNLSCVNPPGKAFSTCWFVLNPALELVWDRSPVVSVGGHVSRCRHGGELCCGLLAAGRWGPSLREPRGHFHWKHLESELGGKHGNPLWCSEIVKNIPDRRDDRFLPGCTKALKPPGCPSQPPLATLPLRTGRGHGDRTSFG